MPSRVCMVRRPSTPGKPRSAPADMVHGASITLARSRKYARGWGSPSRTCAASTVVSIAATVMPWPYTGLNTQAASPMTSSPSGSCGIAS
ncbi:hypothetical protein ACFQZ4_05355 [Catellatospora coxensis]